MNIFAVHPSPITSAIMLCDQHIPKMTVETAQLLCGPFPPDTAPYKRTHYQGRYAKWVRSKRSNYEWLLIHGVTLSQEYNFRYKRTHKSSVVIYWCMHQFQIGSLNHIIPSGIFTLDFPVSNGYDPSTPIKSIREYYIKNKCGFATWEKGRHPPHWWTKSFLG